MEVILSFEGSLHWFIESESMRGNTEETNCSPSRPRIILGNKSRFGVKDELTLINRNRPPPSDLPLGSWRGIHINTIETNRMQFSTNRVQLISNKSFRYEKWEIEEYGSNCSTPNNSYYTRILTQVEASKMKFVTHSAENRPQINVLSGCKIWCMKG